jgi:uncharacterized protein
MRDLRPYAGGGREPKTEVMKANRQTIDEASARAFLGGGRIALVGASDDPKSFASTVYRELRDHGCDVVPVNSGSATVAGDACFAELASVPGQLDGVIVMVARAGAADVVRECVQRRIPRVWLFKGLGGPGSVSEEAVALCRDNGVQVVAGACPLMFLEPVSWFHRMHRSARHVNGSLAKASRAS